nr:hypothetical protein [Mitsuokella multacida]
MATRNFVPRGDGEGSIGTTVKNWAGGFFKKLAIGAITTAVTVLTPAADANNQQPATTGWVRSQFQSILKTVLTAAGLKYNIATNGYICFGSLFGGLILQWGVMSVSENVNDILKIALPIAYKNRFTILSQHQYGDQSNTELLFRRYEEVSRSVVTFSIFSLAGNTIRVGNMYWFSIGF